MVCFFLSCSTSAFSASFVGGKSDRRAHISTTNCPEVSFHDHLPEWFLSSDANAQCQHRSIAELGTCTAEGTAGKTHPHARGPPTLQLPIPRNHQPAFCGYIVPTSTSGMSMGRQTRAPPLHLSSPSDLHRLADMVTITSHISHDVRYDKGNMLAVDAKQVWPVPEAIDYMEQLAGFEPWFFEEPTSPDDILRHNGCTRRPPPARHPEPHHAQADAGGGHHRRAPDRRVSPRRRERGAGGAADGAEVRPPHLAALEHDRLRRRRG